MAPLEPRLSLSSPHSSSSRPAISSSSSSFPTTTFPSATIDSGTHAVVSGHLHSNVHSSHVQVTPPPSHATTHTGVPLLSHVHASAPSLLHSGTALTRYKPTAAASLSMQAQRPPLLNTDLEPRLGSGPYSASVPAFSGGISSNATTSTISVTTGNQKPTKSALKGRKSAPELLLDGATPTTGRGHGSPAPPVPRLFPSSVRTLKDGDGGGLYSNNHNNTNTNTHGARRAESNGGGLMLPDPAFTLLDESLRAQYAHQLRLLQEEYATKAAKAERSRRKSLERGAAAFVASAAAVSASAAVVATASSSSLSLSSFGGRGGASIHSEVDTSGGGEMVVVVNALPTDLHSTPPSSGGESVGDGNRAAFFEGLEAADPPLWDEDVTEPMYRPSIHPSVDNRSPPGVMERQAGDVGALLGAENSSDFEDDGGSDVGDRGHDDALHTIASSDDERHVEEEEEESPPVQVSSRESVSPVESVLSPVQAVVHGHEPSPVSTVPTDQDDLLHVISPLADRDAASLLPLVEVIAPTPVMASKELEEPSKEGEMPKFDEMDKEDGIVSGVTPMSSTDSTESSDSNRTLKTGIPDVGDSPLPGSAEEETGKTVSDEQAVVGDSGMSSVGGIVPQGLPEADPSASPKDVSIPPQEQQEQEIVTSPPQMPPTVSPLTHGIPRGTPTMSQGIPSSASSVFPPLVQPPLPPPTSFPSEHNRIPGPSFQDMASVEYEFDEKELPIRRVSSLASLSSVASSGFHGAAPFPPPPPVYGNSGYALDRTLVHGRPTSHHSGDLLSHPNQHPILSQPVRGPFFLGPIFSTPYKNLNSRQDRSLPRQSSAKFLADRHLLRMESRTIKPGGSRANRHWRTTVRRPLWRAGARTVEGRAVRAMPIAPVAVL